MHRYLVDLRIALFQLNPHIGHVDKNIERTWKLVNQFKETLQKKNAQNNKLCSQYMPQLIVFPEFALTGYSFHSKDELRPYIKETLKSESFKFASKISKLFNCYTVIGYPELSYHNSTLVSDKMHMDNAHWYNSALVTNPDGKLHFNYRKSFLYDTEYEWGCEENPLGFQTFNLNFSKCARNLNQPSNELQDITLKSSIGICMDLSPYKFEAPFNYTEFATFNLENDTELIICPMAWLHPQSITDRDEYDRDTEISKLNEIKMILTQQDVPINGLIESFEIDCDRKHIIPKESEKKPTYTNLAEPDWSNINYWLLRFLPYLDMQIRQEWFDDNLLANSLMDSSYPHSTIMGGSMNIPWEFKGKNAVMVNCNRCGIEDGGKTIFAGSSGIYKFNGKEGVNETSLNSFNKSVELYGNLSKGHEGVLMREVSFEVIQENRIV